MELQKLEGKLFTHGLCRVGKSVSQMLDAVTANISPSRFAEHKILRTIHVARRPCGDVRNHPFLRRGSHGRAALHVEFVPRCHGAAAAGGAIPPVAKNGGHRPARRRRRARLQQHPHRHPRPRIAPAGTAKLDDTGGALRAADHPGCRARRGADPPVAGVQPPPAHPAQAAGHEQGRRQHDATCSAGCWAKTFRCN